MAAMYGEHWTPVAYHECYVFEMEWTVTGPKLLSSSVPFFFFYFFSANLCIFVSRFKLPLFRRYNMCSFACISIWVFDEREAKI